MEIPASRQVLKEFLFTKAQDFLKTQPHQLTRAERRRAARSLSKRIAKKGLEESRCQPTI